METKNTSEMPGANRDEDSGQYQETYPDEDFVDALDEHGPTGTQAVADAVGCSYDHAYKTLRRLEAEGVVSSDRVGNARLWKVDEEAD